MPGLIGVNEFVDETREDYNSPTTSTFVSRMPQCRQTVSNLEEVSTKSGINYLQNLFNTLPSRSNNPLLTVILPSPVT
jgi:hypothetical protein